LEVIVPRGWFLPVTPGTKYVSVAGAIANDVHGKNHHRAGTFGCHVTQFELLRSNGEQLLCSPTQNVELFRATIGGLGLTGLILWAEFTLKPIAGPLIEMERIRLPSLDAFFEVSGRSDQRYEYTVAWIDCLACGESLGRGIFMRGNHKESGETGRSGLPMTPTIPFDFPTFVLNHTTVKVFNTLYYRAQWQERIKSQVHYEPFFYPLDIVNNWNRIYGKRGFMQYQCVVPHDEGHAAIREIMRRIARSGSASFLAVLKEFGEVPSPGILSFPRPGVTLALDFPHHGAPTLALFDELDELVREAGGAVYPAKDARMSAANFQAYFPQWQDFARYVDPHFSSSFWRRVTVPQKDNF
ncbi:MAG: FAD-binding oxidoreductase, partial [Ardenticatenales bacterium]|nr:FAD-binding oxidoreductase [Ardenticatenales bacterium]